MRIITTVRLIILGLMLLVLMGCSQERKSQSGAEADAPPFSLSLSDLGDGSWQLDVSLTEPQAALMFSRSASDYRRQSYVSLTEGARLKRIGGFDTILFEPGVLQAQFKLEPYTQTLRGDYTPFLPFTDGGLAIYLGAFELLRVESMEAVEALQGKLDAWGGEQFDIPITLKTKGTIMLNGEVLTNDAQAVINGSGPYAYVGPTVLVTGNSFSGVLDPGLPEWLVEDLDEDLSEIFSALETGFGRELAQKASILFAFRGYETDGFSNTGGALPGGMLVLETSGNAMRNPNERLRGYVQWFLTHESAHLFQHLSGKNYADLEDSWIIEGGANAITHSILADLDTLSDDIIQERYRQGFTYCIGEIQNSSMAEITRRRNQSHYDCGDFIFRISEAALPTHNIFDLWDAVMAQSGSDETFDTAVYFAALRAQGIDETLAARLEAFVKGPIANPAAELQAMMEAAGIEAVIEGERLKSIAFP